MRNEERGMRYEVRGTRLPPTTNHQTKVEAEVEDKAEVERSQSLTTTHQPIAVYLYPFNPVIN